MAHAIGGFELEKKASGIDAALCDKCLGKKSVDGEPCDACKGSGLKDGSVKDLVKKDANGF